MGRSFVGIAGFRVGVMTEHQVAEFVCDAPIFTEPARRGRDRNHRPAVDNEAVGGGQFTDSYNLDTQPLLDSFDEWPHKPGTELRSRGFDVGRCAPAFARCE